MRDYIIFAIAAAGLGALLISTAQWSPQCRSGDPGVYVGNVLMAGCPRESRTTR